MRAKTASLKAEDTVKIQSMRPGMWVDIQADTPTTTKRARTDLIGIDHQKGTFLLRMPDENKYGNLRDAIYPTNEIIMRLILEEDTGAVVALKSTVRSLLAQPLNYILVDFPSMLQSQPLRSEDRARISLLVEVTLARESSDDADSNDNKDGFTGHIVDISGAGCRLAVPANQAMAVMKNRQSIQMRIKKSDGEQTQLKGVIKNCKQEPLQHFYGVKFDEANKRALKELLMQLMIEL